MATVAANVGSMLTNQLVNNPIKDFFTFGSFSQGVDTPQGYDTPVGNTYRGFGADWFNAENIAKEDFLRNEQAAKNQLKRDEYLLDLQFNQSKQAYEWQKDFAREQMSWEERMSNTSYQRAVQDLKSAGINPVMAINQGGASTPSTPSAGGVSRGSSTSRGGYPSQGAAVNSTALIGSIISLIGGIYGAAAKNAVSLLNASTAANAKRDSAAISAFGGYRRDEAWRQFYNSRR